jgi:hypothetical protein
MRSGYYLFSYSLAHADHARDMIHDQKKSTFLTAAKPDSTVSTIQVIVITQFFRDPYVALRYDDHHLPASN